MPLINGMVEVSKTVTLNAGESATVTFTTIPQRPAEFKVSIFTITPSENLIEKQQRVPFI